MEPTDKVKFVDAMTILALGLQIKIEERTLEIYWDDLKSQPLWAVLLSIDDERTSTEDTYGRLPSIGKILNGARSAVSRRAYDAQIELHRTWRMTWEAVTEHSENQTFLFDSPALQAAIRAAGFDGTIQGSYRYNCTEEKFTEAYLRYLDHPPTPQQAGPIKALHDRGGVVMIQSGLPGALDQRKAITSAAEQKQLAGE